MDHIINAAVQVIPKTREADYYHLIDKAIDEIKASGLKYMVTPMETVIEGPYAQIMEVIHRAERATLNAGADELIVNIKLHIRKGADVSFEEKIEKHKNSPA